MEVMGFIFFHYFFQIRYNLILMLRLVVKLSDLTQHDNTTYCFIKP